MKRPELAARDRRHGKHEAPSWQCAEGSVVPVAYGLRPAPPAPAPLCRTGTIDLGPTGTARTGTGDPCGAAALPKTVAPRFEPRGPCGAAGPPWHSPRVGAAVGAEQLAGASHEYVITADPALNLRAVAKARTNQHSKIYAPPPPPPRMHARTHARRARSEAQGLRCGPQEFYARLALRRPPQLHVRVEQLQQHPCAHGGAEAGCAGTYAYAYMLSLRLVVPGILMNSLPLPPLP